MQFSLVANHFPFLVSNILNALFSNAAHLRGEHLVECDTM
jgi:hypothetical protein